MALDPETGELRIVASRGISEDLVKTPFYDRDAISQTVSALGFIGLCAYLWLGSARKEKGAA